LLTKTKATLYKTLIRPVLLYASETWCVTNQEGLLSAVERKVLRKIFGPVKDDEV
jgi:hypothetical protein